MASPVTIARDALAAGHSLSAVETVLVQHFCADHALVPAPGSLLAATLVDGSPEVLAATAAFAAVDPLTLDSLIMAFETLVPPEDAAKYGAVFTPEAVTSFMATEAIARVRRLGVVPDDVTVVDPAVGCGALLSGALRVLSSLTSTPPHVLASHLYGADVSADSVHRARLVLALTSLYLGDPAEPDLSANLVRADALRDDLPALFGRPSFTVVLGNPPYVRYHHLDPAQRAELAARWESCGLGNFNLYFPFFELAHALADPSGSVVAYIAPNAFLTSLSGGLLRDWMVTNRYVDDVVDFAHHRLFEALTYTAITFAHRSLHRDPDSFGYLVADSAEQILTLPDDWPTALTTRARYADLSAAPWKLAARAAAPALARLAAAGPPLSGVADVRFGVATCRDKLYLLRSGSDHAGRLVTSYEGVTYWIEPEITRPCRRASSLATQSALDADSTRILYPYDLLDGRAVVVDEPTLADRFPGAYEYLLAIRPELARRDNGRKAYPAWYAYARTQGLTPASPRLLTPLYAARPRFLVDLDDTALFLNGCSVSLREDAPDWLTLDLLAALLNSALLHYFVESTARAIDGGFFAYQKAQLGPFPLAPFSPDEAAHLLALDAPARDRFLAAKYGLELPAEYLRAV